MLSSYLINLYAENDRQLNLTFARHLDFCRRVKRNLKENIFFSERIYKCMRILPHKILLPLQTLLAWMVYIFNDIQ